MTDISPFLSKPAEWVEELGALAADRKKIEEREEKLKGKLKLHMQEKGLEAVSGEKFDYQRQTGERTDTSIDAILQTFGEDAVTKLPKKKTESFKLVARKVKDAEDRRADDIVKHFSGKSGLKESVAKAVVDGLDAGIVIDETKKRKKEFPK